MEYRDEDRRLFGSEDTRPTSLKQFLQNCASLLLVLVAVYGAALLMLSIEKHVEQPTSAAPAAEKLSMHPSFVIGCDATVKQRGAGEKWTPPTCYVRGESTAPSKVSKVSP